MVNDRLPYGASPTTTMYLGSYFSRMVYAAAVATRCRKPIDDRWLKFLISGAIPQQ